MSALLYLGVALLVSAIAISVLWYRNRKPKSLESGIDEFRQGLRALAPNEDKRNDGGGRSG